VTVRHPRVGYLQRRWDDPPGLALLLVIRSADLTGLVSPTLRVRYTHGPGGLPSPLDVWGELTLTEPVGISPQHAQEREDRLREAYFPNPRAQLRWVQVREWNVTQRLLNAKPAWHIWRLSEVLTEHL
jgi:hypothetical protein